MSLLARELESLGYVTSAPDPADRRASIVVWSEQGEEAALTGDTTARSATLRHCRTS